jgi:hypothetical protein
MAKVNHVRNGQPHEFSKLECFAKAGAYEVRLC